MQKKVLVITNAETLKAMLRDVLSSAGFEVFLAPNVEEGMWRSVSDRPDAVVIDTDAATGDGWDVCRQLRHTRELRNTSIIALTSDSPHKAMDKYHRSGCDLYMRQPFNAHELVSVINILVPAPAGETASASQ